MKTKNKPKNEFFIRSVDYGVEEDTRTIKGVIPYNSDSVDMNGITERITPTAFNKTLADKTEVKCLLGHDMTKILGSSGAGTLRMVSEKDGLHFEVDLPNTTDGNDAYELIQRGDCTTLSFGFVPVKVRSSVVDNHEVNELVEVKLLEISVCVAFPAYPEGNTSVRSFFEKCGTDFEEVDEILKHEELTEEDKKTLKSVVDNLEALLNSAETDQQLKDTDNATDDEEAEEEKPTEEAEEEKKEEASRRARFIFFNNYQE
jgi:uncharacterized protein